MASGKGLFLKLIQWFLRGIQFGCAAIVLGIFSYFLATLNNHDLRISNHIRAVEGISGIAVIYTIVGLLLLCCLAGHPFTSFIAIVLDIAFAGAFAYVAWVNRDGASSCNGYLNTPYGSGQSSQDVQGEDGFTNLPSFRQACRLQTAAFAVSLIAIFFFLFSVVVEIFLARHRKKEKRFGPGPNNNYTSGSGKAKKGPFLGGLLGRKKRNTHSDPENKLPEHTTPSDVRNSYNTETTAVPHNEHGVNHPNATYNKHGESGYAGNGVGAGHVDGYGYANGQQQTGTIGDNGYQANPNPNPYRYEDGVFDRR